MKRGGRRAPLRHKLFLAVVLAVLAATIWPGYVPAARIQPYLLGLPFALAWLVGCLAVVFVALWLTFRGDMRRGRDAG